MFKTKTYHFILIFCLIFFSLEMRSQDISINEIVSSNNTVNSDEDGDFEDWIEIYNYGTTAVNLSGFGLSDQLDNPLKWKFPAITLPAKGYLLIWASDKNRSTTSGELHTNFKIKSGGEAILLSDASGTKIDESAAVAIATDNSYGRTPDGTGGWSFFTTPTPNDSNTGATSADPEKIAINEFVSSNTTGIEDEDASKEDWIEFYNYGSTAINLNGFGLSDEREVPYKWVFPNKVVNPGEYILVWASGKDRKTSSEFHTNFKISATGETLFLTNTVGILVSGGPSVTLATDTSYGRQPDGTGSFLFFNTPTPRATNSSSGVTTSLEAPEFSHASGLYSSTINVSLSTNVQNATIVYTLDGSEPDINNLGGSSYQYKNEYPHAIGMSPGPLLSQNYSSFTYTSPIAIDDRTNEVGQISRKNSVPFELYIPPNPVRKGTVLRAKVYVNGKGSRTRTRNYFIWPDGNPYKVPITALTTYEGNLFEYVNGIYTPGKTFDDWRADNPNINQAVNPNNSNFGQSGIDWERNVNVQLFDTDMNSVLNQDAGIRIHGNSSRIHNIKNLRLYARSEYDEENEFEFRLFDQQIPESPNPYNNDFKRILLRGDGGGAIANDVVFNRLMQPFFYGVTRIQTTVDFINGEFFGISALRDRFDQHHLANNFDLDSDNIDIVNCLGTCTEEEGDRNADNQLRDLFGYIKDNDLSVAANYQYVVDRFDVDSYINHLFLEIFSEGDSYETKYWRTQTKVNDGFGDGRWRVYTQDFESAMRSHLNWLQDFLNDSPIHHRGLLSNFMENDDFKNKLLNRFSDLMNTGFTKERVLEIVDFTFNEVAPMLEEDRNRAPRNQFYLVTDKDNLQDWIQGREATVTLPEKIDRHTLFRDQLKTAFNLNSIVDVELRLSYLNAGYIKINTVNINNATPGVPEKAYPWSGKYFEGIPITLEAFDYPGFTFSNWSGNVNDNDSNRKITINPTGNINIQAVYTRNANYNQLIYFWLFDDNLENDKPLESIEATYSRNNTSGTLNYSSSLTGYPFNASDPNYRKGSLERQNNPTSINYISFANNEIAYDNRMMKGIQLKQPFKNGGNENTIVLNISTKNFADISLDLAIESDGAAQTLLVDYWNGSEYSTANITSSYNISDSYESKQIDFKNVTLANDNENLKIRLRFNGANLTEENGKSVSINNISVHGVETTLLSTDQIIETKSLKVFPNPTTGFLHVKNCMLKLHLKVLLKLNYLN